MVTAEQSTWLSRILARTKSGGGREGMVNPDAIPGKDDTDPKELLDAVRAEMGLEDEILVKENGELIWHSSWIPELLAGARAKEGVGDESLKDFYRAEIKRLQAEKRRLPSDFEALLDTVRQELGLTDEIIVQENGELTWHRSWVPELLAGARAKAGEGEERLKVFYRAEIARIQEEKRLIPGYRPPPLAASVGAGGKNREADVRAVQTSLMMQMKANLASDGICGPKTISAIKAFQKNIGLARPDGLIEPGKATERALAGG